MQKTMMFAHRMNINKYHRLLKTKLNEIEREFIERRLVEEEKGLLEVAQRAMLIQSEMQQIK